MQTINQTKPINIIGIELRTSNTEAVQTIPPMWQKFYQEGIMNQIPNKVSNDVYAVYTNFENEGKNNEGTYSLIIGAAVESLDNVPEQFVSTTIPASKRVVFEVEAKHPEKVGEKWMEIWKTELPKTFTSDYELYKESGEIEIHIGVKE
jgi:predicted transcriptional regulator YdeE